MFRSHEYLHGLVSTSSCRCADVAAVGHAGGEIPTEITHVSCLDHGQSCSLITWRSHWRSVAEASR